MNVRAKLFLFLLCITGFSAFWKVSEMLLSLDLCEKQKACSCDKCISEEHPWFMQRFKKSISPFLTRQYNLSEEDFNWWKKLQHEKRDLNFFRATKQQIFELFPSKPDVTEPSPEHCRSCAVVGNSINLKRSHYGRLIDYHDIVFRLNRGKTEGYEEDVGTKTTHRVMYPESAVDLNNTTHLVFFPFKMLDFQWLLKTYTTDIKAVSNARLKKKKSVNNDLVMVANPAFMKYVHESWLQNNGKYPSTGFMTLVLAMHICDEVSVFGFGADSDGNWSHYWEILRSKTGPHHGSVEYDIIVELAKQGKVTFYKGW